MIYFFSSQHIVFRLRSRPFYLISSLFCICFTLLLPLFFIFYPLSSFFLYFIPFFFYIFPLFLFAISYFFSIHYYIDPCLTLCCGAEAICFSSGFGSSFHEVLVSAPVFIKFWLQLQLQLVTVSVTLFNMKTYIFVNLSTWQ